MPNYTILLIDYEPRSIERFRDPLTGAGFTVEIATDGLSGIEAFDRLNPDMVLVEAMIPKKHGFEVCQELKRTAHGRRTPILITTSVYKGRKYRTQALHNYGCDEYIEKPIGPEQLLEIVGRFLTPGGATAPAPSMETSALPPEPRTGPTAKDPLASSTHVAAPRGTPTPKSARSSPTRASHDDSEAEIMARLDALLPISGTAPASAAPEKAPTTVVETFTPPEETAEIDPLAQIRAELDAELNAVFGIAEPEPSVRKIPSDHAAPPAVLEVLPEPTAAVTAVPEVMSVAPELQETFREPQAVQAQTASPSPAPASKHHAVSKVALPQSHPIEIEPAEHDSRSRGRVWPWVGALVVVGVVGFLLFTFFVKDGGSGGATTLPSTPHVTTEAKVPPPQAEPIAPPPAAEAPALREKAQVVPDPPPTPSVPTPAHAAAPTPAHTTPTKPHPANRTGPPAPSQATEPPAASAPEHTPAVAPPAAPPLASAPVPSAAAPTTAQGSLIPIDQADVLPKSVSRTAPRYPADTKGQGISGTVIMNVLVNEHGTVDQVVMVAGTSDASTNDSVTNAAKSWTYRPASKGGVPVKVWKSEEVTVKP